MFDQNSLRIGGFDPEMPTPKKCGDGSCGGDGCCGGGCNDRYKKKKLKRFGIQRDGI